MNKLTVNQSFEDNIKFLTSSIHWKDFNKFRANLNNNLTEELQFSSKLSKVEKLTTIDSGKFLDNWLNTSKKFLRCKTFSDLLKLLSRNFTKFIKFFSSCSLNAST